MKSKERIKQLESKIKRLEARIAMLESMKVPTPDSPWVVPMKPIERENTGSPTMPPQRQIWC